MIKILIIAIIILIVLYIITYRFDRKFINIRLLSNENIYTKRIYYIAVFGLFLLFIGGNYYTSGKFLQELFYKLESDFGLDFFVFFSDSVLNQFCYIDNNQAFNPPLIKIISLFIFRSFPLELQEMFFQSAISDTYLDIRLVVQATLPFILFIVVSIILLSILLFSNKTGILLEKYLYVFLTLGNVGIIFAIERGNYVLIAIPFTLFFVLYYKNNNKYLKELSLIFLGIAAGLKIYPCILGILLIRNKMWKESFRAVLYGIFFIFSPFVFYGGFSGIKGFLSSLINGAEMGITRLGTLNITSFYNTFFDWQNTPKDVVVFYMPYLKIISYFLFILAIVCIWLFQEEWKRVLILTLLMILYSGTAHTYMLSFLIIPIFLFFNNRHKESALNYIYLLLYILLSGLFVIFPSEYIEQLRITGERVTELMLIQQNTAVILFVLLLIDGIGEGIIKYKENNFTLIRTCITRCYLQYCRNRKIC